MGVSLPARRAAPTTLLHALSWGILLPLLPLRWLLWLRLHVPQWARATCAARHVCLPAADLLPASKSLAVSLSRTALLAVLHLGLPAVSAPALRPKHHSCLHVMQQTSPTCASVTHARRHAVDPLLASRSLAVLSRSTVPHLHPGPRPAFAAAHLPSPSHHQHQQQARVRALLMVSKARSQLHSHRLSEVPRCAARRAAAPAVDLAVQASLEAPASAASEMATSMVSLPARRAAPTTLLHALSWGMLLPLLPLRWLLWLRLHVPQWARATCAARHVC